MDIRIPEVGESVREALLAKWFKKSGEVIRKDEPLCEIETDKITLDINAETSGTLAILVAEGSTVKIGTLIGTIAESVVPQSGTSTADVESATTSREDELKSSASSPSVRREMREKEISPDSVTGTGKGGRITLDDLFTRIEGTARRKQATDLEDSAAVQPQTASVLQASPSVPHMPPQPEAATVNSELPPAYDTRREERRPMSPIRKRISERLVAVRQQTAMLTTFNEVDMSRVVGLRTKYRDRYKQHYGISLGLMPFFVKACVEALRAYPVVNAHIDGDAFVYHNYYDFGVAIGSEKGLVVPVLRDVDAMKLHEVDLAILDYKQKIATNRISISDLSGGTFTISNGGVYGSMLSTPILNPPQSAVLGMHAIQDRPVARDGQVVICPMMYLALSYDHCIIDGREAVSFLKKIKEYLENVDDGIIER